MIVENIEISWQKVGLKGEMKLVDKDLSKDECEELISRMVSWKLGRLTPDRHFEMIYNDEKHQAEADVYVNVSVTESDESHIDVIDVIYKKLMEFLSLYHKEFKNVKENLI